MAMGQMTVAEVLRQILRNQWTMLEHCNHPDLGVVDEVNKRKTETQEMLRDFPGGSTLL